jgi:prepilin-type processing-associated H-X9-DG protein
MFEGVLQPYLKNHQFVYCPEAGQTPWASIAGASWIGAPDPWSYNKELDAKGIYEATFCQMAVNELLTEFGPDSSWTACSHGGLYTAGHSNTASWTRPAELMLLTGDSVWGMGIGGDLSPQNGLGNTSVWPAYTSASKNCFDWGNYGLNFYPGFTWYLHKAPQRSGYFKNDNNTQFDLGINSGFANIAFADGHVKPMKYNNLERCDYNTQAGVWTYTWWDPRY